MERLVGVGVSWKLTGQIAVQLIRLLTVAILARFLTPADYGAAAIAIALTQFAPTVADMGLGSALVQAKTATPVVRSTAFWASIGFGVALFVAAAAAAGPRRRGSWATLTSRAMVVAGGLTFAIYSVGSTSQAMFMRRDEVSQHRASQLACARRRRRHRRHCSGQRSGCVGAGPATGLLHDHSRGRPLVAPRVAAASGLLVQSVLSSWVRSPSESQAVVGRACSSSWSCRS